MRVIGEKVEEELVITNDTLFLGIAVGSARVAMGATLEMQGIILGDLVLDPGTRVLMDGIVHGNVINEGGLLEVFGIVHGEIRGNPGACLLYPVKRRIVEALFHGGARPRQVKAPVLPIGRKPC